MPEQTWSERMFGLTPLPELPTSTKEARSPATWALKLAIRLYQRFVSANRNVCRCRSESMDATAPHNCSALGLDVVRRHGAVQGLAYIVTNFSMLGVLALTLNTLGLKNDDWLNGWHGC